MAKNSWIIYKGIKIDRRIKPRFIDIIKKRATLYDWASIPVDVQVADVLKNREAWRATGVEPPMAYEDPFDDVMVRMTSCAYMHFLWSSSSFSVNPFIAFGVLSGAITIEQANDWLTKHNRVVRVSSYYIEPMQGVLERLRESFRQRGAAINLTLLEEETSGFLIESRGYSDLVFEADGWQYDKETEEVNFPKFTFVYLKPSDRAIEEIRLNDQDLLRQFRTGRFYRNSRDGYYQVFEKGDYRFTKDRPEVPWD